MREQRGDVRFRQIERRFGGWNHVLMAKRRRAAAQNGAEPRHGLIENS